MVRRITDETKKLMAELYAQNLPVTEVARQANVSYLTAYGYTRARQSTNPETGQPFKSLTEYQNYLARQRTNPETGQPFKSRTESQDYQVRQSTNPETGQPFKSLTEYQNYLARQRKQNPINQELSDLVPQRLTELEQTQRWLAAQLGITEGAVSRYISGRTTPRKSLQKRLFNALELPYQTLDDLLG